MKTTMIKKQILPALTQKNESMINARQASHSLCLPYYWFSDRDMRMEKRLPHYCLGGVVRFRLSELLIWANQMAKITIRKDDQ